MRAIIILLILSACVFAAEVKITADRFHADEKALRSRFSGNVIITKGEDILTADVITIDFNEKQEPLRYEAQGSISVNVAMNGKRYHASGNTLTYDVTLNKYTLEGDAFLEDITTNRKVYGNLIMIDQNNSVYVVDGSAEPVKFIFQIDDAKSKEDKK
ncbi:MAG: lipopolysaccharide transport periplasmic protein LptA [Campylobacteraceae bacterium]|jgi:lipopolysaccharide export system protein LptA|nr:lipopolysaccharide transport periplasmic protein LptA [Campylobacteraceae bacterium]